MSQQPNVPPLHSSGAHGRPASQQYPTQSGGSSFTPPQHPATNQGSPNSNLRQDSNRLWEDTKKWIDEVQKRLKLTRPQLAQKCGVSLEKLQAWYTGPNIETAITTTLRQWVKRILDQQMQQQNRSQGPTNPAISGGAKVSPQRHGGSMPNTGSVGEVNASAAEKGTASAGAASVPADGAGGTERPAGGDDVAYGGRPAPSNPVVVVDAKPPAGWSPFFSDPSASWPEGRQDLLAPIRLDVVSEGRALRDAFCWDCGPSSNSGGLSIEMFAHQLCEDSDLPPSFEPLIINQMQVQIQEFVSTRDESTLPAPGGWERLHKIRINVRVNDVAIDDMILWDLKSSTNSPELFARRYCEDLQLPADLVGVIAVTIREEMKIARKRLREGQDAGVVTFRTAMRSESELPFWSPKVRWLTSEEKERLDRNKRNKMMRTLPANPQQAPQSQTPTSRPPPNYYARPQQQPAPGPSGGWGPNVAAGQGAGYAAPSAYPPTSTPGLPGQVAHGPAGQSAGR